MHYTSHLVIFARARQRGVGPVGADGWRKLHCEHGESVNRRRMQVRRKEFGPATKVQRAIRILVSVTAEDTM